MKCPSCASWPFCLSIAILFEQKRSRCQRDTRQYEEMPLECTSLAVYEVWGPKGLFESNSELPTFFVRSPYFWSTDPLGIRMCSNKLTCCSSRNKNSILLHQAVVQCRMYSGFFLCVFFLGASLVSVLVPQRHQPARASSPSDWSPDSPGRAFVYFCPPRPQNDQNNQQEPSRGLEAALARAINMQHTRRTPERGRRACTNMPKKSRQPLKENLFFRTFSLTLQKKMLRCNGALGCSFFLALVLLWWFLLLT